MWTTTRVEENMLEVTERAMERRMFGISLRDHIRNDAFRRLSGVKDIVVATRENKLRWAGHIARAQDGRWSSLIKDWLPRESKRSVGRPPLRWNDYLRRAVGQNWREIAQDRKLWSDCARRVSSTH